MAGNVRTPDGIPVEKEQVFRMAQQEMEYRVDLFNKLTQTCFEKCIERNNTVEKYKVRFSNLCLIAFCSAGVPVLLRFRYKESELNVGENSCIDRCVAKYWQVTGIVGQMLGSSRPPGT